MSSNRVVESKEEKLARLDALETIIETVGPAYVKGMAAMNEILEDQLWKLKGHKKEEDYLAKRWPHLSQIGLYRKKRAAKVAAAILGDSVVDGVRESHLACLSAFEPEFAKEILEAAEQTAPGGKLTAQWIEQTARRLNTARLEAIKADADEAKRRAAEAEADDEEDDEEEEAEDTKPTPRARSSRESKVPNSRMGHANNHPITRSEQDKKLHGQFARGVVKLERISVKLGEDFDELIAMHRSKK